MVPQENYLKFDALRWLIFGHEKITLSLHFSPGMVREFVSHPHALRLVSVGTAVSATPRELCEEMAHESQSKFCFAFSLDPVPSNTDQECVVTVLRSPHSCLCLNREVHVGTNMFRQYSCFLPNK